MPLNTPLTSETFSRPIGIFDSGIGGLTIVDNIKAMLPNETLVYLADNKHAPYGDKQPDFIIERVNQIADYFIRLNVKAIVIACNTATVIAIDQLRKRIQVPVVGVEPAIKPAALTSKKQKVAILATQATANNQRFLSLVQTHSENTDVFIQPCPGLVEAIENDQIDCQHTQALIEKYVLPLKNKGIDKLVLGCTHYPMLFEQINALTGEQIELIDTGLPVATQLKKVLETQVIRNDSTKTPHQWLCSEALTNSIKKRFSYPWQTISL